MNENLMGPLNDSKLLKSTLNNNNNFELDSNATSSTMVPAISTLIKNDSLLKNGTWAYLDSGKNKNRRYLFWTSVNVSNFPTGTKIPVIMQIISIMLRVIKKLLIRVRNMIVYKLLMMHT